MHLLITQDRRGPFTGLPRVAAAACVLTLAVAGCGSGEADADPGLPTMPVITDAPSATAEPTEEPPAASEEDTATSTTTAEPPQQTSEPTSTPPATPTEAAVAAVVLAQQETGGTAYQVELDDGVWVVDVAVDSSNFEVAVDLDGLSVISARPDGPVDTDDLGKLAVATVSIEEAMTVAADEVGGDITEVDLDTESGVVVWKVDLDVDSDDIEVSVSATTGEVLTQD